MHSRYRLLGLLFGILALGTLVGCGDSVTPLLRPTVVPDTAIPTVAGVTSDIEKARGALEQFFALLHDGRYADAVLHYGGDYSVMRDWNPDIPAGDYAQLFASGCMFNGLRCLKVRAIVEEQEVSPGVYQFTVEFANEDGSLFSRGPCCGATETEMPTVSQFVYTVKQVGGEFLVQELPVYIP